MIAFVSGACCLFAGVALMSSAINDYASARPPGNDGLIGFTLAGVGSALLLVGLGGVTPC